MEGDQQNVTYNFDDSSISSAIYSCVLCLRSAEGLAVPMLQNQLNILLKRQLEMYGAKD